MPKRYMRRCFVAQALRISSWVQDWVQLERLEWLRISGKRHQTRHLDFWTPRLLTEGFQLLAHAEVMPFALRVRDIKFVTDNSAETVAHSDFLELHNSCTIAAEHDISGPDRGRSPERKFLIPNTRPWNREFAKPL